MTKLEDGVRDRDGGWVLVTGGAGFIGSHTVDALLKSGRKVIVFDNFSTGSWANIAQWSVSKSLRVVEGDVCDGLYVPLRRALGKDLEVRSIVHLAAQTSVVNSVHNPLQDIRNNYVGTVHTLDFARMCNVESVVFASSSSVYSDGERIPTSEGDSKLPVSPYAINKLACEYLLRLYEHVYEVSGTVLRFFNVYGPRQKPDSPYSGVISVFCKKALAGEPLTVHGDGSQTRDFVHVTDVVSAICAAGSRAGARGEIINVGSGTETTIRDLAETVVRLGRSRSAITYEAPRVGSVHRSCADIRRARSVLEYSPRVDLRSGLEQTLDWFGGAATPSRGGEDGGRVLAAADGPGHRAA